MELSYYYILTCSILQARLYEVVYEVYQIIIPVHVAKRQFRELEKIHIKLVECFKNIVSKVTIFHILTIIPWNLIAGR